MATSGRNQRSRPGGLAAAKGRAAAGALGGAAAGADPATPGEPGGAPPRLAPVRLAPRDELAAAARVAPLLRAASDVARWVGQRRAVTGDGELFPPEAALAAADLELTPPEFGVAWRVAVGTGMIRVTGGEAASPGGADMLASGGADEILIAWNDALTLMLAAENLDGLATALYTVGGPVKMEALFDAYMAAAGPGGQDGGDGSSAAELSAALEELADLGVVELGTDEPAEGLTVALSRLGVWGVHRHLRAQGWHVPVLGDVARGGAADLLVTLADCDIEDGEAEIAAWLGARDSDRAARELIAAARDGTPGLRGAGFAVLDRIGVAAVPAVRDALGDPEVRAHAAVWLHEHGEEADIRPEDRAWLLVDLGAGLLEEADPRDVVVELLPDLPTDAQVELVSRLWTVAHPGVTDLLTVLSDHHPDPAVSRAARKAAFKARSPVPVSRSRSDPRPPGQ